MKRTEISELGEFGIINQINWDEGYHRKDIGWRYIDE